MKKIKKHFNTFKENKKLKFTFKRIIPVCLIILIGFSIYFYSNKKSEGDTIVETGHKYATQVSIDKNHKYNLKQKDYIKKGVAPVFVAPFENGNGVKFKEYLQHSAVLDTDSKLPVISAHDYGYFGNIKNSKLGDIYELENVKTKDIIQYKVIASYEISAKDSDEVYDESLDSKNNMVLYTCTNHIADAFNPQFKWVVKLERVNESNKETTILS